MKTIFHICLFMAASLFIASCSKDDELKVFSLNEKLNGHTYQSLASKLGEWYFSTTIAKSGLSDEDGSLHKSQPLSGVVFLGANFGLTQTRSLTVKSSDIIFADMMGTTFWYFPTDKCDSTAFFKPANKTDAQYLESLLEGTENEVEKLELTLDGAPVVTDFSKYLILSDVADVSVHQDWMAPECSYAGKKAKLRSKAYSVAMKLPKGDHTLIVKGQNPTYQIVENITWKLKVE
jgi:hypothetical protein